MSEHAAAIYQDLPQEERNFIQQMIPFTSAGNPFAMETMEKFYQAMSDLQAARLYYGMYLGDPLACLILGRYHLHGWMVFHRDRQLAETLLMGARQSKNDTIAQAADRELMVLGTAIQKTFDLSYVTLNNYTGSERHVVVPPALQTIGHGAFKNNEKIESVVLPGCLQVIESEAFLGCKNLRVIHIPDSVRRIEFKAFEGCEALEKVVLPKNLTHLGAHAFAGCKKLTSMDLPGSIADVEEGLFRNSGLTEAVLRPGIRSVGARAFSGTPLKDITLPQSLERIEAHAFSRCEDLTRVLWEGGRHLVAQYTLKRDNDPFRNAAHFYYDFNSNQILSHYRDPEPIRTSPHFPARDIHKETYPVPGTE